MQEQMTNDSVADTEPPTLPEEPDNVRETFTFLCSQSHFFLHALIVLLFPFNPPIFPLSLTPFPSLQPPLRTVAIKVVKRWFWVPLMLGGVGTSIFLIYLFMRKRRSIS